MGDKFNAGDHQRVKLYCTFQAPGFHRWQGAPAHCAYLSQPHRHIFHVRVEIVVTADRQVEFIGFKNTAKKLFLGLGAATRQGEERNFSGMSCETMAAKLAYELGVRQYRVVRVEVSEDGENGAIVEEAQ